MININNTQVAKAFAGGKTSGKGSNLFIDGDTIFSYGYHFPIARRTEELFEGKQIVLFTLAGYSISTSKHICYVRSALYGSNYKVVEVMDLRNDFAFARRDLISEQHKLLEKASRCRKDHTRLYYISKFKDLKESADIIGAKFYGLNLQRMGA